MLLILRLLAKVREIFKQELDWQQGKGKYYPCTLPVIISL
jgi:hypothetical protein